jgi:predicted nucleotidyltransferase
MTDVEADTLWWMTSTAWDPEGKMFTEMTTSTAPEDPALSRLVSLVVDELHPLQVWLFGSRAEGRARPDSDYDLLVVLPDDAPASDFDDRRVWTLGHRAGVVADVIPCTSTDFEEEKREIDTLPRAAFLRGRLLYER